METILPEKKIDPAVKRETLRVAIGSLILSFVMELVFVLIGKWDYTVLLGNLLGLFTAVLNFFLMAVTITNCMGMEKDKAALKIRASQFARLLMMGASAACAALLPCFNIWAALIPLLFPSLVIAVLRLIEAKKNPRPPRTEEEIAAAREAEKAESEAAGKGEGETDENRPAWD